ncbi:hypothetical protein [Desulfopila sp. IMCC35008]|uniref:hypothetical protein n=1 Tax=Desulfopila sp. IMCC35008 TaxID=2653858 RepID=UPI0013D3A539|nr:hypothetical protein [Desulfopila sp. IMCC35008]
MKRNIVFIAIAALTLTFTSIQPGMAKGGGDKGGKGTTSQGSGHHDNIDSGRDFGQHVKDMNDHFSGDHNPGSKHKGYSGLKD